MKYIKEGIKIFFTSIFLLTNVLFLIIERIIMVNLTLKLMKVSFLVIPLLVKKNHIYNKRNMIIEEYLHVTFDETNFKSIVEVEVIDCVCILEKNLLEDKDTNKKIQPFH